MSATKLLTSKSTEVVLGKFFFRKKDTMAKRALIEILDKQGVWIHYRKVANNPASIEHALQAALKTPLASMIKSARALEAGTNIVLRIEHG